MAIGLSHKDEYKMWPERENVILYALTDPSVATSDPFTAYPLTAPDGKGAAKRRAIKKSEIIASDNQFSNANMVWIFPLECLPVGVTPKTSYKVEDADGNVYSILEVIIGKFGQTFRCVADQI